MPPHQQPHYPKAPQHCRSSIRHLAGAVGCRGARAFAGATTFMRFLAEIGAVFDQIEAEKLYLILIARECSRSKSIPSIRRWYCAACRDLHDLAEHSLVVPDRPASW